MLWGFKEKTDTGVLYWATKSKCWYRCPTSWRTEGTYYIPRCLDLPPQYIRISD